MRGERLSDTLYRLDGRPYPAYKDLRGHREDLGGLFLTFESIQGDPFASPSRIRVDVSPRKTGLPTWAQSSSSERIATADFLHRCIRRKLGGRREADGSGKSGQIGILGVGQEILERSAVAVTSGGGVRFLFTVGLPASGRRIRGRAAATLLTERIPDAFEEVFEELDLNDLQRHIFCLEDQMALRDELERNQLVAFVANQSILARKSGVDDRPLASAIPFESPSSLEVALETPHRGVIRGMGIPKGITLIVGGGYHGKSTLLQALARGVYNHVPEDGRECTVTHPDAAWIRAEDGRSVRGVDLRPFITNLPLGRDTASFETADASGSTSQAAGTLESLELGAKTLLIDEDIAATNFMIRDGRMRALIPSESEPITPYLDRVEALSREAGVSSILVVGGAGDYLSVADRVIQMENYRAVDVTERAREVVSRIPSTTESTEERGWPSIRKRFPILRDLNPRRGNKRDRVRSQGTRSIQFGEEEIDLSLLEQLIDPAQARLIGDALLHLHRESRFFEGLSMDEVVNHLEKILTDEGIDGLCARGFGDRARPRKYEIGAALNRMRGLGFRNTEGCET